MKKIYYLYKEILPNFLFSILFILLFDVLNYNLDITNSRYVIYYALLFTILNYILTFIVSIFELRKIRTIPISEVILKDSNKLVLIFLSFKIIKVLVTISSFVLIGLYYDEYIVFNTLFIPIIIGFIIEILKIILNIIFKFDKIIMLNEDRSEFNEDLEELIENILKEEDVTNKLHSQEKTRKTSADLEKVMKQTPDPIEKEEEEE